MGDWFATISYSGGINSLMEVGMAKFNVHMTAYEPARVRVVEIPDDRLFDSVDHDLELIFMYGQNDFQPQNMCSVSVGDMVEYKGKLYTCAPNGWDEVKLGRQYVRFESQT